MRGRWPRLEQKTNTYTFLFAHFPSFFSKNFNECLQNLIKLEATFGCSTKLMQNKAVAEFYKSDFKRYEKFRQSLNELIGDVSADSDEVIEIKDIANLVPLFNKAILLFQLRQPMAALKIILVLLKHLDLVDRPIAQRIGLLAINILLNLNQPKRVHEVIALLRNRLRGPLNSPSDDGIDILLKKVPDPKLVRSLTEFKWMFRWYKLRSDVLNDETISVQGENVRYSHDFWFFDD